MSGIKEAILLSTMIMVDSDIEYVAVPVGEKDVWKTYSQSINEGANCNDIVIAMYTVLLGKGVPDEAMALVAGRLKRGRHRGEYHMVLQVEDMILDSLRRSPMEANRYFDRYMDEEFRLNPDGLFVKGKFWMTRDMHPEWNRIQES